MELKKPVTIIIRQLAGQCSLWHIPELQHLCRRSSGVERALGKGEASGSIPLGGTIL